MASNQEAEERLKAALADRYAIEREIGAGGMATVYLAEDLKHDRAVALKVLKPELAAVMGTDRFLAEIRTTANLTHPHILPLFDSGEADGFLFYVMPFVEGESLRQRLEREGQLSVQEGVRIAGHIADALDYAHRHGVIHRDIKPANILFEEEEPVIADFGIALAVTAGAGGRLTETGLSLGTPYYMSPEQAAGDQATNSASDVYSLGCVLYEMLAGEPPHTGSSAQAILGKILLGEVTRPTKLRSTIPANVEGAILKALERVPADRFGSAASLSAALKDKSFCYGTVPEGGWAPTSKRWKNLAFAVGAVALVSFVTNIREWSRIPESPPAQVLRYPLAFPEGEGLWPSGSGRLALSPDGSRLVYVGSGEGSQRLWVRLRDKLNGMPLTGTEGASSPFFSPDGEQVGFFTSNPRTLRVSSISGGLPLRVTEVGNDLSAGTWSPDGFIYIGSTPNPIVRIPPSGGRPETVTTFDTNRGETAHMFPDALPNGRGVVFTIWHYGGIQADYEIAVADLKTGEHRVLVAGVFARFSSTGHLLVVRLDGTVVAIPFDQDSLALVGSETVLWGGVGFPARGGVDISLSQTGSVIYCAGEVGGEDETIVWRDCDGGEREVDPGWIGDFGTVALSPDGRRLAVSISDAGRTEVWIKELDLGPFERFAFEGTNNYSPAWTPDGRSIAFVSNVTGRRDVYRKPATGGTAELLLAGEREVSQLAWSPDEEWLAYRTTAAAAGFGDIMGLRFGADSALVPLAASDFSERDPAISPDGRWLAYQSNLSGRYDVYVRPLGGAGEGRRQVSLNGGEGPVWAHNGHELFYRTGTGELEVVAIVPDSSGFDVGRREQLFSLTGYGSFDVAPGDERFVMVRTPQVTECMDLLAVENWPQELRDGGR